MLIQNLHCIQPNFLGFNAVYHGYAGLNDQFGRIYNEELCELEADRAAELGIKVARTFYKWTGKTATILTPFAAGWNDCKSAALKLR